MSLAKFPPPHEVRTVRLGGAAFVVRRLRANLQGVIVRRVRAPSEASFLAATLDVVLVWWSGVSDPAGRPVPFDVSRRGEVVAALGTANGQVLAAAAALGESVARDRYTLADLAAHEGPPAGVAWPPQPVQPSEVQP